MSTTRDADMCERCGQPAYEEVCVCDHDDMRESLRADVARLERGRDEARQEAADAHCVKCGERPRCVTIATVTCDEEIRSAAEGLARELDTLRSEATVTAILAATGWTATPDATVTRRVREVLGMVTP